MEISNPINQREAVGKAADLGLDTKKYMVNAAEHNSISRAQSRITAYFSAGDHDCPGVLLRSLQRCLSVRKVEIDQSRI